jgi:hypothetical protein
VGVAVRKSRGVILRHPLADRAEKLAQLRWLAHLLDSAIEIPGTKLRIGLDGFIGLIPGIGDFIGLLFSAYFLFAAAQMQVPKTVLARMGLNILLDTVVGAIPLFGDAFDFVFGANQKNMDLLERHLVNPRKTRKQSAWYLIAIALGIVAALVVLFFVVKWVLVVSYTAIRGWN